MGKKSSRGYFGTHAKSSAMMVSLVIHTIFIVAALSFVAVKVIIREEQTFEMKKISRPKVPLRKLQVPVNIKKRKIQPPKLRKTIVAKPKNKTLDIKMPEIVGIKGGTGYMNSGGLGSLGFGLDIDLFGSNKSMGNELTGTFYDLKKMKNGKPSKIAELSAEVQELEAGSKLAKTKNPNTQYIKVLNEFANKGWRQNILNDYFKAPREKYASFFMIPMMSADAAPKAYGVENIVKPKHWVAYYNGQISPPETGYYRFCGLADDVLLVRVRDRLVIDASYPGWRGKITTWESEDENNRKFPLVNQQMVIGDWFKLTKGKSAEIEVLIGECPGGQFYAQLLIEQKGKEYEQVPYSVKTKKKRVSGTRPVLPIFKTKKIPQQLVEKMKINPKEATLEGPSFGVRGSE